MLECSLRLTKVQCYYSNTNGVKLVYWFFQLKPVIRWFLIVRKIHIFIAIPTIKNYHISRVFIVIYRPT